MMIHEATECKELFSGIMMVWQVKIIEFSSRGGSEEHSPEMETGLLPFGGR